MASAYALEGKTLLERLEELYALLGRYAEDTISLVMPGVDGLEKMQRLMASLRSEAPEALAGIPVVRVRDYLSGTAVTAEGKTEPLPMKDSDVLYYELSDGSRFIIRPSGTEPKIKCYLMVKGDAREDCAEKLEALTKAAHALADG